MANKQIVDLTGQAPALTDVIEIQVPPGGAGTSFKSTVTQLFATPSPTLVTPIVGVATATSVNKVAITAPATGSTLTIQDGFTLTVTGNATIAGTPPTLSGANAWTGVQTITPAVNAKGIIGASVTHTASAPFLDIAQTWNNGAVAFTAAKINVTNTASDLASAVLDVQVGGVSKLTVTQGGTGSLGPAVVLPSGVLNSPALTMGVSHLGEFGAPGLYGTAFGMMIGGSSIAWLGLTPSGLSLRVAGSVLWSSSSPDTNGWDLGLARNTAGILEINDQTAGNFRDLKLRNLVVASTLATNMTDGFINIGGAAGPPSGTPSITTGFPLYWDSMNLQLYAYTGGAWKKSAAFT